MEERDSGGDEMGKGGGGVLQQGPHLTFQMCKTIKSCNLHETFFPQNPFFFFSPQM